MAKDALTGVLEVFDVQGNHIPHVSHGLMLPSITKEMSAVPAKQLNLTLQTRYILVKNTEWCYIRSIME